MNTRSTMVALLALGLCARGEELARLSIPDLLRPETRLRAFQAFRIRAEAEEAPGSHGEEMAEFARSHEGLAVSTVRRGHEAPRYLVTWRMAGGGDRWGEVEARAGHPATEAGVLVPAGGLEYQLFSADGAPLGKAVEFVSAGQIADVKGEGEPEVIEQVTVYGEKPALSQGEFLAVHPLDASDQVSFALLYNTNPLKQAAANTWGFQLRPAEQGGYVIELGPVLAVGVEPKVSFQWDPATRAWTGPEGKPGDHFRILRGKCPSEEADRILEKGGLGYPLAPGPAAPSPETAFLGQWVEKEKIPPDRLSKPYRYQSLKGRSNEDVLAFMGEHRAIDDYVADKMREATAVPDFWTLEPKAAALQYVERNRPPAIAANYLVAPLPTPEGAAPEEGELTLSDGPSGCFAPGGAYIHHLHCARAGSYLAFAEILEWPRVPFAAEGDLQFDFRRLDLPYAQARHLLQTLWWMTRVRTRHVAGSGTTSFMSGGSTSDGYATVQIIAGEKGVAVSDMRSDGRREIFQGVGTFREEYDPSAFLNLVVQLFRREVPDKLGAAWKAQGPTRHGRGFRGKSAPPTPEELARVKMVITELLQLFREGKMAPGAALQAAYVVGEMGWQDLGAELEAVAKELPPLLEYEKRLAEIQKEIDGWKAKLGARAEEKEFLKREGEKLANEPAPFIPIPGVEPKPVSAHPKTDEKFAEVDALYSRLREIRYDAPRSEQDIAGLRGALPVVLRELRVYHDAEAIERWALEEESATSFALTRLSAIAPQRAIALCRHCEAKADNAPLRESYAQVRQALEAGRSVWAAEPESAPLSSEERAKTLTVLRDGQATNEAREKAFYAHFPANDPKLSPDPEMNAALLELLNGARQGAGFLPFGAPMAAAHRLGGKAWKALVLCAESTELGNIPRLGDTLPALTVIAQAEPEPYRAKLQALLAPELDETNGWLDRTLWSIWQLDLRELKPKLEQIATSGPGDYEGDLAMSASSQRVHLTQRYHRARQIAALWNEEDPLTRAKLLVAFAAGEADEFADEETGAGEHLAQQIALIRPGFEAEQRVAVGEFIGWCEKNAAAKLGRGADPEEVAAVLGKARAEFGKSP